MLSAVLKSLIAVNGSIRIIDAFVSMRKFLLNNAQIFQRLKNVELKQIETVRKIDKIFDNRQNRLSYRGIIEGFRQKMVCFCGIECR